MALAAERQLGDLSRVYQGVPSGGDGTLASMLDDWRVVRPVTEMAPKCRRPNGLHCINWGYPHEIYILPIVTSSQPFLSSVS